MVLIITMNIKKIYLSILRIAISFFFIAVPFNPYVGEDDPLFVVLSNILGLGILKEVDQSQYQVFSCFIIMAVFDLTFKRGYYCLQNNYFVFRCILFGYIRC